MSLRPITLTHARLRAAQGDASAARRICRALLELDPDDARAAELLARLTGAQDRKRGERAGGVARTTRSVSTAELRGQFQRLVGRRASANPRTVRLERWSRLIARGSASRLSG